jgi:hypothetical protein
VTTAICGAVVATLDRKVAPLWGMACGDAVIAG